MNALDSDNLFALDPAPLGDAAVTAVLTAPGLRPARDHGEDFAEAPSLFDSDRAAIVASQSLGSDTPTLPTGALEPEIA